MTDQKIGLIVISPMVIATAFLLKRQGAMGTKGVGAVFVATLVIAVLLFINQ